ncbi:regulator of microtubule dynamics protein 1-like [Belonocnema kinseyi]|uniref:regulator of microtubule dynamics protein 1-like n=1 Tax=Belonocnema kinseyi TaxID=2817044 RepID=UPI00143D5F06|nr:regulator of microtubule dynamics protein 1-like [Belonocnema kinseyi]XP_033224982.1 regulator of microtubule dynamics protein 1-like [Belonocnema kinseyi]XP_033224983.1 regulator of microtubule dynamics protein 1-like [Belonocnema kinseyi]
MSNIQNSTMMAVAISATVGVLTAATLFIYNKILEEKKQHTAMNNKVDQVNRKVLELQAELNALRTQQKQQRNRRKKLLGSRQTVSDATDYTATDNETDIDAYSVAGTDIGDDEFFDCSDSEGGAGDMDNRTAAVNGVKSSLASLDEDRKDKALQTEIYYKLKSLASSHPNDIEIIWRLARACHDCSTNVSDPEMQKEFIFEGITACEAVLGVPHADLYKWYAVLVGLRGKFMKTKEKIMDGYLFAEYVEKALELRPEDSTIQHLLGRFKYEISTLTWIERKVAATLFAQPPSASYEDAIVYFKRAESLAKEPFLQNKLYLGKSHIALGQYKEGVEYLNQIYELPTSDDEPQILKEVKELLDKYSGYLS